MVEESCPENKPPEDWDWKGIHAGLPGALRAPSSTRASKSSAKPTRVVKRLYERRRRGVPARREKELGVEIALRIFRHIYIETIDEAWVDHLSNMEHLRDGIGLRGYGQRDPKNEYKKEGYNLFLNMMAKVSGDRAREVLRGAPSRSKEEIAARRAGSRAPLPGRARARRRPPPGRGRRPRSGAQSAPRGARRRAGERSPAARRRGARRSAATTPVPAARARSSRSATARSSKKRAPPIRTTTSRNRGRNPGGNQRGVGRARGVRFPKLPGSRTDAVLAG